MNSSTVKLGDIAKVFNGKTPAESEQRQSGFPVLKIRDVDENGVFRGRFNSFVDQEFAYQFPEKQIFVNDVMILNAAHNADYVASKLFFANERVAGALSTGEWLIIRTDEEKADPRFIHFWLQDARTKYSLRLLVKGIHLYPKDVAELKIPLPLLTEQKRIASLLARLDRLRQLRRTAHDLGDALLQSVFLEMFGDGSKFDRVEFEEILDESPKNGLYLSSDEYGSGTPIIRIDAFYDGVLGNPAYFKRLRATPKQIEEFNVQNDEILINRVNSLEYLGKCALVKGLLETTLFESNMMRIRLNRKIANPVYVTKYLTTPEAYSQIMQKAKKAVNQASINQQDVKSIVIPVPPLSLQEEFAGVVARVESLRGRMGESTRQVEGLFESLLSESFGG
jgi:type I restriction enzyme, S subunit